MKILALYLPQFHSIEENDLWWGKNYTEWTAVKNAKPLFKNHIQPKIPFNNNYYTLDDEKGSTWRWQAKLAKEYGIYGFSIYNYWFKGKKLLEKPVEILLKNKDIDLNYSFCWANEDWTRTWYGLDKEVLMKQEYGFVEDWIEHFNYLVEYFKDDRYIKINNKPVFSIYKSSDIKHLKEMLDLWNELAKKNNFDGLYIIASNNANDFETREELVDAYYNFEPGYSTKNSRSIYFKLKYNFSILIKKILKFLLKKPKLSRKVNIKLVFKEIIKNSKRKYRNKKIYKGIFTQWDNTPRRKEEGTVYYNSSPKIFYKTLLKMKKYVKNDDFLIINAWNEWGEGCYLEPDVINEYKYLEALNKVFSKTN
jgi:hypothetical protein